MSKGLYIHIPFCKYICSYCDFGKKYIKNQPVDDYIDKLVDELDLYSPFTDVDTIYIGGGTPSSLTINQLGKLFAKLDELIDYSQVVEFTFEMNPDDVTEELLRYLKCNHVSRLSIGIQTLNDDILKSLHRNHSQNDANNAITIASSIFDNISVDFMFNLPNQTKHDIDKSLEFIKVHNIDHISYYGLIFEEHTILQTQNHQYWSEDYESEMYSYIQTKLSTLGFEQYEISNYAKAEKYQSRHNIHYWNRDQYIGVGLSASGFLGERRYTNTYSLKSYLDKLGDGIFPVSESEDLNESDIRFEKIMLGLRYYQYISIENDIIQLIKNDNFLKDKFDYKDNEIRLKREFYYISNQVILDILERIEC